VTCNFALLVAVVFGVESSPQTFILRDGVLSQFESLRVGQEDIQALVAQRERKTKGRRVQSYSFVWCPCRAALTVALVSVVTAWVVWLPTLARHKQEFSRCHLLDTLFPRRCMCARSGAPSVRITSGDSHQDNCCGGGGEGDGS
jgi:hypothetical protein